jgi:hypothetical protein
MPGRGDRRPVTLPADEQNDEKTLDRGAPAWGIGLRADVRHGFAGLQRDIRIAIAVLAVIPLVAMGLMAALVGGSLNFKGFGVGFATTPAAISSTPPTSTSTTHQP